MATHGAVFVDLDRTLLVSASGPVFQEALEAEGVIAPGHHLPGESLVYGIYNRVGETVPFMLLARAAARVMRGRSREATVRAGKRAVEALMDLVAPLAPAVLAEHRAAGRRLVLATTSPYDLVAPFAEAAGFDDVIATRYESDGDRYTGRLSGRFTWGVMKRAEVRAWAAANGVDLGECHAYTDSVHDLPLLMSVGHPHPLNADARLAAFATVRRWPLESWDRPPGVPTVFGWEAYHALRLLFRPEAFPYARFSVSGVEHIPAHGPVILAANHRSYFDVAALGIVCARIARPVRFLGKKEIFDAPVIGALARALGGISVDRKGDPSTSMDEARVALGVGDVVVVLPQGTIPQGEAFFEPRLTGHTGAVRLAAETGAPIVPIGLWGTEEVWPRSARVPNVTALASPPHVTVTVGEPISVPGLDAVAETQALMDAIAALLPEDSRHQAPPDAAALARTRSPG